MDNLLTTSTILLLVIAAGVFLLSCALRPLLQKRLGNGITGIIMYAPAAFIATTLKGIVLEGLLDSLPEAEYPAVGLMTVITKYTIEKTSVAMF